MIPRYILEAFGLIFVAILAYFLNQNNIGGTFALQTWCYCIERAKAFTIIATNL